LIISTGEEVPSGQSTVARTALVHVRKGYVDLSVVSRLQQQSDRFPHAMAGYVRWLSEHYEMLGDRLKKYHAELRGQLGQELAAHARAPDAVAGLQLGLELFASFAKDVRALQPDEAEEFLADGRRALVKNAIEQATHQKGADPVELFIDSIRSLLEAGEVTLVPKDSAVQIGKADGAHVLLLPDVAYREANRFLQATNRALPVSPRTLWSRMNERELLLALEPGHLTRKREVAGKRMRVLTLRRDLLLDDPKLGQAGRFRGEAGQPGHQAGRS